MDVFGVSVMIGVGECVFGVGRMCLCQSGCD